MSLDLYIRWKDSDSFSVLSVLKFHFLFTVTIFLMINHVCIIVYHYFVMTFKKYILMKLYQLNKNVYLREWMQLQFPYNKDVRGSISICRGRWVRSSFLNVAATVTRLQVCRLLLSNYTLLAGMGLYHVICTCCVGVGGVIWRTALFKRLVLQARDTKEKL